MIGKLRAESTHFFGGARFHVSWRWQERKRSSRLVIDIVVTIHSRRGPKTNRSRTRSARPRAFSPPMAMTRVDERTSTRTIRPTFERFLKAFDARRDEIARRLSHSVDLTRQLRASRARRRHVTGGNGRWSNGPDRAREAKHLFKTRLSKRQSILLSARAQYRPADSSIRSTDCSVFEERSAVIAD